MKKNLTCRQHVRHGKEIAYNIENDIPLRYSSLEFKNIKFKKKRTASK